MTGTTAIYCRISQDATEEGLGVQRQEQDCRRKAAQLGLEFDDKHLFIDNDRGASNLSKKARPAYDRMLEAIRAGEVRTLIAYSNSRLTRRPAEWVDLINLANAGALKIVTCQSGDHDLTTADGRAVALTIAAWDAAEAERTGERVRRAARQSAEQGRVKKGRYRTFGYTDDFEVIDHEADVIRDAFRRVIAGESLNSIARLWQDQGVALGNGKMIHQTTVKNVVKRPLYAGLATYKGEIVGTAQVTPIVSRAVFDAAQVNLSADARPMGKNARRYLLSGYLYCSLCLYPMQAAPGYNSATKGKLHAYRCSKVIGGCGRQGIDGVSLETLVLTQVRHALILRGPETPKKADRSDELTTLEQERQDVLQARERGDITVVDAIGLLDPIRRQISQIEREQAQDVAEEVSAFASWDDFKEGNLSQQKATVGRYVSKIIVSPSSGPRWDAKRVTIIRTNGQEIAGDTIRPAHLDPRVIVDGFRQDPSLVQTKGAVAKKSQPIKGKDGKFKGAKKA